MKHKYKGQRSKLWVPKSTTVYDYDRLHINTNKQDIDESNILHDIIQERNKKIRNARLTPFAETEMGRQLHWDGFGATVDIFLDGT